jgi:hypothetical protein
MDPNSDSNLSSIDTENKLRKFVSDLISPLTLKVSEHEQILKELQTDMRRTKLDLGILENEFLRKTSRMVQIEDFNKRVDSLSTETKSKQDELTFALSSSILKQESQQVIISDLKLKLNSLSESNSFILQTLSENFSSLQEFKSEISKQSQKAILKTKSFIDEQELKNNSFLEKINKLSIRVSDINSKGLPHLSSLLDDRNLEINTMQKKIAELFKDRVISSDVLKIRNKFEGDLKKFTEEVSADLENIITFLDTMLRIEISCGVSDTLLKVLDTRQIKKLIPVVQTQLKDEPKVDINTRRISLDVKSVQPQLLYTKTQVSTKSLENSLEDYRKKIERQEEEQKKMILMQNMKTLKVEEKVKRKSLKVPQKIMEKDQNNDKSNEKSNEIKIEEEFKLNNYESIQEIEESACKSSVMSLDIHSYQEQIDKLSENMRVFEETVRNHLDSFTKNVLPTVTRLDTSLESAKKEFRTSNLIFSEEIHHLLKLRSKEITELQCKHESLSNYHNTLSEKVKDLEQDLDHLKKTINKSIKCLQMTFELMNQDEIDRQSLHLAGFLDKKEQKSPQKSKISASLKPECLSCSGNSLLLFSAFKLACLNYYPSEVNFEGETFSRPGLLSRLQWLLKHVWDSSEAIFTEDSIFRAKSTGKVKTGRHILDASLTKSSFQDSPKKLDLKIKKFNFH